MNRRRTRFVSGLSIIAVGAVLMAVIRAETNNHPLPYGCTATAGADTATLDVEQAQNATTIAAVGKRLGLPNHAVTIALATAMQESDLRNLDYGDRDSVGLFQQRPSQGWGTVAQIRTPSYAATAFYNRLRTVRNWQDLSVTAAAQAVQRSAAPDAYAQWEGRARTLARAFTGEVPAGFACHLKVSAAAIAAEKDVTTAMKTEIGSAKIGVDVAEAPGWLTASWLVGHASTYGITAVTFREFRWTAKAGIWKPVTPAVSQVRIER